MLLIVYVHEQYSMRIYGDRVVSSDLRGEDVNFILGRYKLLHLCFDQTFLSQT